MGRQSIRQELRAMLAPRCRFGESKHKAKISDQQKLRTNPNIPKYDLEKNNYFFSKRTFDQYVNTATRFCKWANEQAGHRLVANSEEIKEFIEPYIQKQLDAGYSIDSVKFTRTVLGKVFKTDLEYIYIEHRHAPQKGRNGRDAHWNPDNHKEQVRFYESIGARKGEYRFLDESEIHAIENKKGIKLKRDVHGRISNIQIHTGKDGLVDRITVLKAKHGKTNHSIIHPNNRAFVTEIFTSGKYEQFYNPPDHCNVHACRRKYAQSLYMHFRRNLSDLPPEELYVCRGELVGCRYDKKALDIVSRSLGHGNGRYYDVVHHYLR